MMNTDTDVSRSSKPAGPEHVVRVFDFSETPGARYPEDGPWSGEDFRRQLLIPAFQRALDAGAVLLVDLDDAYGYATSFLEEAFGGLAEVFGTAVVMKHIELRTTDEPELEEEICGYISRGDRRKKPNRPG